MYNNQEPMRIVKDPNGIEPDRIISESQYQKERDAAHVEDPALMEELVREELKSRDEEQAYQQRCIENNIEYLEPAHRVVRRYKAIMRERYWKNFRTGLIVNIITWPLVLFVIYLIFRN